MLVSYTLGERGATGREETLGRWTHKTREWMRYGEQERERERERET